MKIERACPNCDTVFETERDTQWYCDAECRDAITYGYAEVTKKLKAAIDFLSLYGDIEFESEHFPIEG